MELSDQINISINQKVSHILCPEDYHKYMISVWQFGTSYTVSAITNIYDHSVNAFFHFSNCDIYLFICLLSIIVSKYPKQDSVTYGSCILLSVVNETTQDEKQKVL